MLLNPKPEPIALAHTQTIPKPTGLHCKQDKQTGQLEHKQLKILGSYKRDALRGSPQVPLKQSEVG